MENKFTKKAQNALALAQNTAEEFGHTYIGSEHLLSGLAQEGDSIASKMLQRKGIGPQKINNELFSDIKKAKRTSLSAKNLTPRMRRIIEGAHRLSERHKQSYIGSEHLLYSLLSENDCFAVRVLEQNGIYVHELQNDILTFIDSTQKAIEPKKRSDRKYSIDDFGKNLNDLAKNGRIDPTLCREKEMERVIQILSRRTKNNPCLVGEPGVGKTAVAEGLAQRIVDGAVPPLLKNKVIYSLDIPSLIAGAKYRGEFEERLKSIMQECAQDNNILLFIDEIHTIIGAGSAEGAIDAANILKPALSRGELQVIGATTITEYRKYIERDSALERRFQPVSINEPSDIETKNILFGLRSRYEAHHGIKITDEAIDAAVELSKRYINDRFLPDKAIDLIDEAASRVKLKAEIYQLSPFNIENEKLSLAIKKEAAVQNSDFSLANRIREREIELERYDTANEKLQDTVSLTYDDVASIVTDWTGIPVNSLAKSDSNLLISLEDELKKRIVGQDKAIKMISNSIRRGRLGLKSEDQPTGSFIFIGPTGVGKTELCNALAETIFGSKNALIRFDMSEYMEKHSVSRLIGSPPGYVGYGDGGLLTEKVRRYPYSLILFDEIEKAHPDIFNLLLQILEDGSLTDSQGRTVSFRNTVIVMTSNLGANNLSSSSSLGFISSKDDNEKAKLREKSIKNALKNAFKSEFLNRVDEIIIFNSLSVDDLKRICSLMLDSLQKRLDKLNIELEFSNKATDHIVSMAYDENEGARKLRRIIRRLVENPLTNKILQGEINKGDYLLADETDGKIIFIK